MIIAMRRPRTSRSCAVAQPEQLAPVERDAARHARAGEAREAEDRERRHRLARAALPREADDLAAPDLELGDVRDDAWPEGDLAAHESRSRHHLPRVEDGAQAVAQQVEAERRDQDREPRERDDPPVRREQRLALADHQPPLRRRILRAEAEERERGGGQDDAAEVERELHRRPAATLFGSTWRSTIRQPLTPSARAAAT